MIKIILAFALVALFTYGVHSTWKIMSSQQKLGFFKISGKILLYSFFSITSLAGITLLF